VKNKEKKKKRRDSAGSDNTASMIKVKNKYAARSDNVLLFLASSTDKPWHSYPLAIKPKVCACVPMLCRHHNRYSCPKNKQGTGSAALT